MPFNFVKLKTLRLLPAGQCWP